MEIVTLRQMQHGIPSLIRTEIIVRPQKQGAKYMKTTTDSRVYIKYKNFFLFVVSFEILLRGKRSLFFTIINITPMSDIKEAH